MIQRIVNFLIVLTFSCQTKASESVDFLNVWPNHFNDAILKESLYNNGQDIKRKTISAHIMVAVELLAIKKNFLLLTTNNESELYLEHVSPYISEGLTSFHHEQELRMASGFHKF
ncbi:hypothetical protein GQX74_003110 [Glossina fuscipes]|nr:hypothetical protein GQX74_003110 [Glossina fuscipes]